MKGLYVARVHLFTTLILASTPVIENKNDDLDELLFTREWLESVVKVGNVNDESVIFTRFELKKLCAFSRRRLLVPYIDEDYKPQVHKYQFEYTNGDKIIEHAVDCGTLPSLFLRPGRSYERVIAMSVKHTIHNFKHFEVENPKPIFIRLVRKDPNLRADRLAQLNHHSRQCLCSEAGKHLRLRFIDNYVFGVHTYEFVYSDMRAIYNAVPCPTYPPVFVRLGTSEHEAVVTCGQPIHQIEIVRNVRPIDIIQEKGHHRKHAESASGETKSLLRRGYPNTQLMEYYLNQQYVQLFHEKEIYQSGEKLNRKVLSGLDENERKALCVGASNHINYKVKLSETVPEAAFLIFDYGSSLKEVVHFAISCSVEEGDMFLYLGNSLSDGVRVKIVLLKSKLLEESIEIVSSLE